MVLSDVCLKHSGGSGLLSCLSSISETFFTTDVLHETHTEFLTKFNQAMITLL